MLRFTGRPSNSASSESRPDDLLDADELRDRCDPTLGCLWRDRDLLVSRRGRSSSSRYRVGLGLLLRSRLSRLILLTGRSLLSSESLCGSRERAPFLCDRESERWSESRSSALLDRESSLRSYSTGAFADSGSTSILTGGRFSAVTTGFGGNDGFGLCRIELVTSWFDEAGSALAESCVGGLSNGLAECGMVAVRVESDPLLLFLRCKLPGGLA